MLNHWRRSASIPKPVGTDKDPINLASTINLTNISDSPNSNGYVQYFVPIKRPQLGLFHIIPHAGPKSMIHCLNGFSYNG
jgi:hypothetical protein